MKINRSFPSMKMFPLITIIKNVSYFTLQSLISILLILIKSTEKSDSTIIYQIFSLASQLTEQIAMKCLSSSNFPSYSFRTIDYLSGRIIFLIGFNFCKTSDQNFIQFIHYKSVFQRYFTFIIKINIRH